MAYTEYAAVVANNPDTLITQLTQRIADGWQPYGSAVAITEGFQVMQAVVKGSADGGGSPGAITSDSITDASAVGKAVLVSADAAAALAAIGAGTSSFSGSFNDLSDKPNIPAAPADGTAEQLETGNDATKRVWSAKAIHDEVARQIAAISKK